MNEVEDEPPLVERDVATSVLKSRVTTECLQIDREQGRIVKILKPPERHLNGPPPWRCATDQKAL